MNRVSGLIFGFICGWFLLPATIAQAQETPVTAQAKSADKQVSRPALWRLDGPKSKIYLFGSVTILRADDRWFDGPIETAFAAADELVVEVDNSLSPNEISKMMIFDDGQKLSRILNESSISRLKEILAELDLPPCSLDQLRPWAAAMSVSSLSYQNSRYAVEYGVESILLGKAKDVQKRISYLDSQQAQLNIFAELSVARQIEYLNFELGKFKRQNTEMDEIADMWRSGQPEKLPATFESMFNALPWLEKPLMTDQNSRWAGWVDERAKRPGTVFVTVTAGHLAGENSMLHVLERMGHRITRIQ